MQNMKYIINRYLYIILYIRIYIFFTSYNLIIFLIKFERIKDTSNIHRYRMSRTYCFAVFHPKVLLVVLVHPKAPTRYLIMLYTAKSFGPAFFEFLPAQPTLRP